MVSSVIALRVDSVKLPHATGEIPIGCLDDEVIVIRHQGVGMAEYSGASTFSSTIEIFHSGGVRPARTIRLSGFHTR
jgi:hypothetical protein